MQRPSRDFPTRYLSVLGDAVVRYRQDRFGARAQAIAYTMLFSFVSLLATAATAFGLVLRDEATRRRVIEALIEAVALTTGRSRFIQDAAEGMANTSTTLGPLSLLITIWGATRTFRVIREALEDAWRRERRSPFLHRRLAEAAMFLTLITLMVASIVAGAVFGALVAAGSDRLGPRADSLRAVAGWGGLGLAFLLALSAFLLVYRFVPAAGQSWRAALAGALPAALAFEALRSGFTFYIARFAGFNPVYGALSSVFLFLLWANLAATILLLGAETTVAWVQSDGGRTLDPVNVRLGRFIRPLVALPLGLARRIRPRPSRQRPPAAHPARSSPPPDGDEHSLPL